MEDLELRRQIKEQFTDFLEQDFGAETGHGKYEQQLQDIIKQYPSTKSIRLEVDLQGEQPIVDHLIPFRQPSSPSTPSLTSQRILNLCRFV